MKKLLTVYITITLFSLNSFAGGFQVNLQGNRQLGMGHCGIGMLMGSSTTFFNPGGVSFLKSNSFSFGTSLVFANTVYQEPYPGMYQTRTLPGVGTPFYVYGNYKPKEDSKIAFGLSINTPFGSTIAYEEDWAGAPVLQKMSLKAFFFQPTVSYKLNDKIGIGAGVVYGTGSFLLQKAVPVQDQNLTYGQGTLTGSANGLGYNVGVYAQISDQISLGATYRSGVAVSTDQGNAEFNVTESLSDYFPTTTFSTTLNMPSVGNIGLGYKVNEEISFALDVNYVGWSAYDSLKFDFVDNTDKLEDIASPRHYKDVFIYRLGVEYNLNEKVSLRGGAYYDMTPVQDGYITPETPGSDKLGITCGASLNLDKLTIDFALLYAEGDQRTDTNLETQFGGTWKSNGVVAGLGLEYNF